MKKPTHPELVQKLAKKPEAMLKDWSDDPRKAHLLHMASKLQSEASEVASPIFDHVFYGKELDIESKNGIRIEMGDLLFFVQGILAHCNLTIQDCLESNIDKLSVRYGKTLNYTDEAAIARVDKNDGKGDS